LERDLILDFIDKERREKLITYYLLDFKTFPKISKLDKFANTIEINFDLTANAQMEAILASSKYHRFYKEWPCFGQFRKN
jgi:hypothetical protein